MILHKPYTNKEYADLAIFANDNKLGIVDKGDYLETEQDATEPLSNDIIKMIRASASAKEVDPLMNEYLRKKTFDLFEDNEEQELLKLIELKVNRIKAMNPYNEE